MARGPPGQRSAEFGQSMPLNCVLHTDKEIHLRKRDKYHGLPEIIYENQKAIDFIHDELFTLGVIAKLTNRDISTIRRYIKQGIIPAPRYKNSRGWSLYTRDEAVTIVKSLREQ
jgi:hypothetical protein